MAETNKTLFRYSFVKIMTGSDLSRRHLPLITADAPTTGPLVWFTACAHGEEVGGMVVIHEVFKRLRKSGLLKGRIRAFPLMNPIGFESLSRYVGSSKEDLNRCFPGDAKGTMGQRMAERIFSTLTEAKPDLVVDLHHDWIRSVPYGLLDKNIAESRDETMDRCLGFLKKTGLWMVWDTEVISGSLSNNLIKNDIPALTLELGEPNVVNEEHILLGVRCLWNLLVDLEMAQPLTEPEPNLAFMQNTEQALHYYPRPLVSSTGIIRYHVKPGEKVKTRQKIAQVYNSFGKSIETLTANAPGILLGHADNSAVIPGMQVFAFGNFEPS